MRLLWVKLGGLWPCNSGGRLRSFNMLRSLSRMHEVTVITTREPGESAQLHKYLPDCCEIVEIPFSPLKHTSPRFPFVLAGSWVRSTPVDMLRSHIPAMAAEVRRILLGGGVDICVADFLFAVPNVPMGRGVPVVLFEHNVEYMIWRRLAHTTTTPLKRLALEAEWRRLRAFEARACAGASCTVAVSQADRDALCGLAPEAQVYSVATGVDTDYFFPQPEDEKHNEIVFVGSMDWYPNEEAMRWFADAVLAQIRRAIPDVAVTVVGRNPTPDFVRFAQAAGMRVTGTVEDIRPWMARASVCIVPLRIGGGTRLKIFEALAMGKATVSTTIGAEGLPVVNDSELAVADEAGAFAETVVALLHAPERRQRMGEAGRRLVTSQFGWHGVAQTFSEICEGAEERRGVAPHQGEPRPLRTWI